MADRHFLSNNQTDLIMCVQMWIWTYMEKWAAKFTYNAYFDIHLEIKAKIMFSFIS